MAHLARQRFARVRLAQQFDARIEPPAVHDGVFGIAGGEQHRQLGRRSRALRASSGLRRGPGMTTSVNSRSIGMPLSMMLSALVASFAFSTR
jgi:hypothetical protein